MVASISALSSASAAKDYYGKDNYYAKDKDEREPSAWFGTGADALGLKGAVDLATFERVLRGETLDGKAVGHRGGETLEQALNRKHRPGIDLTFSPPKDVSLLLYLGCDQRLLGAHRKAVDQTLKWAERNLAGTRVRKTLENGKKGPPQPLKTGNLVIAKFEHDISRDKDPQLHTHSVIANMTKAADGSWRALHNDPFFRHRKTLSLAYDASLRENLRALGYQVKLTDGKAGSFEIVGMPSEARAEFSKGAVRINKAAAKLDHPTPAARATLAVKTRPAKTQVSQDERTAQWEERGALWKQTLEGLAANAALRAEAGRIEAPLQDTRAARAGLAGAVTREIQNATRPTRVLRLDERDPYAMDRAGSEREAAARAAASFGLKHHEQREAAFSLHHIRRTALEHAADGVTLKDIDKELRLLRRSGKVMVTARDPDAWSTTRRSVSHEERTQMLVSSAGETEPLMPDIAVDGLLKDTNLTLGQRSAIKFVLGGRHRLVGVQGYAGTGKTTMMRQTKELLADLKPAASRQGVSLVGLAPTHAARKELEKSLGIDAQTVAGFLRNARSGERSSVAGSVVVVDESSFLSTKQMNRLLGTLLEQNPARVVLSGDRRQHGAVDAGRPFDQAQAAGMTTAIMKDVVRLPSDEAYDERRRAVIDAGEGRVGSAMTRLQANIIERPDGNLAQGALEAWKALPRSARDKAMIVAPGHRLRNDINAAIRDEMISDGRLGPHEMKLPVLHTQDMTKAEATSPRSYRKGDILAFHARQDAVNAKKGATRTITTIDEERGLVTLRNSRGGLQTIKLSRLAGRYETAPYSLNRGGELRIRQNDKLLFTHSERGHDIAALTSATVKAFDEKTVTLDVGGQEQVFERSDAALRSLTHGYAITSHASQGQTTEHVVTAIDSREHQLTNQAGFYVSISRSADTLSIVTDNKDRTLKLLERETGTKTSALDARDQLTDITGLELRTTQPGTEKSQAVDPGHQNVSDSREASNELTIDHEISR
ncbi:MAG: MobF family relaxase [Pseudomonadota bacterium]